MREWPHQKRKNSYRKSLVKQFKLFLINRSNRTSLPVGPHLNYYFVIKRKRDFEFFFEPRWIAIAQKARYRRAKRLKLATDHRYY